MARDLLCFSHLRWDFVYQRPNHLMSRAAQTRRVFFVEEPAPGPRPALDLTNRDGVTVVTPRLPEGLSGVGRVTVLREQMSSLVTAQNVASPVRWYYTPMSFPWSSHLTGSVTVYDVMDELSGFRGAPPDLLQLEAMLIQRADLLLTGGRQLFESKRSRHDNVHLFPSSVDISHFQKARRGLPEPADQALIARPRLGYFGVIDERIDFDLLARLARRRPEWQIVLVGPTVKVDESELPRAQNIHYLGLKDYNDLPAYLAGWDVALMPFALNEATRYISPTKTPEYLAGGRPVASTPIRDVVDPYGTTGVVSIGDGAIEFERAVEAAMSQDVEELRRRADALLATMSWDRTWAEMEHLVEAAAARKASRPIRVPVRTVPRLSVPVGSHASATTMAARESVTAAGE